MFFMNRSSIYTKKNFVAVGRTLNLKNVAVVAVFYYCVPRLKHLPAPPMSPQQYLPWFFLSDRSFCNKPIKSHRYYTHNTHKRGTNYANCRRVKGADRPLRPHNIIYYQPNRTCDWLTKGKVKVSASCLCSSFSVVIDFYDGFLLFIGSILSSLSKKQHTYVSGICSLIYCYLLHRKNLKFFVFNTLWLWFICILLSNLLFCEHCSKN